MGVEIRGAEKLAQISRELKALANKDLNREMSKGITEAIKPVRSQMKQSAMINLPSRNGLNKKIASTRFRTVRRVQGIRLVASNAYSINQLDQEGVIRHPVYARGSQTRRQWAWVSQRVQPRVFSRVWDDQVGPMRAKIDAHLTYMIKRIGR